MKEIGCTTPSGLNWNNICKDTNKSIQAFKLFYKLNDNRMNIEKCLFPCHYSKISVTPLIIRRKEMPKSKMKDQMQLIFDKYIKVTQSSISYTGLELLAELGGYVGLFLGLSVFDLKHAIYKIINYS